MKLQRSTLVLLAAALVLGGVVYLNETRTVPSQTTVSSDRLFGFQEEAVQSFVLTTPTQTLAFTKTPAPAKPDPTQSRWNLTTPTAGPANDGSVAFLLNLLATGKRQQTLTAAPNRKAEFGLDVPLATVDVTLDDRKTHRLILGKPNFNRTGLYAQIDPPAQPTGDLTIALVPIDFENAVSRPLTEWKAEKTNKSDRTNKPDKPKSQ